MQRTELHCQLSLYLFIVLTLNAITLYNIVCIYRLQLSRILNAHQES